MPFYLYYCGASHRQLSQQYMFNQLKLGLHFFKRNRIRVANEPDWSVGFQSKSMDFAIFETLIPSRFVCFTIPNPSPPSSLVRVAVLDSPSLPADSPQAAAIVVPLNRESDWVFSTESGHLQLLLSSPGISRLILIGNNPSHSSSLFYSKVQDQDDIFRKHISDCFRPLLIALSPKQSIYDVPILDYEDNLISSVVLEKSSGSFVGEMLVEDVEIDSGTETDIQLGINSRKREFRRRLRFKRMPNLIQSEIRILPTTECVSDHLRIVGEAEFVPDMGVLVHPYLTPMVAALSLLAIPNGVKPKALCLGVGGGALLSFLSAHLSFEVFGVEIDEEVLRIASKYFTLKDCGVNIFVGNAMETLEKLADQSSSLDKDLTDFDAKFDVIMVDLDSCDARSGISAPPLEFLERNILLAASSILCDTGILILNVIPPSRSFYDALINVLREFFDELYEIDVGNDENFVLVAKKLPAFLPISDTQNSVFQKVENAISGQYLDSIRKI